MNRLSIMLFVLAPTISNAQFSYAPINVPGAVSTEARGINVTGSSTCCWSVNGISDNGILSGQVFKADFWEAWMKISTDEDFYRGDEDTRGTGLNSNIDTIGYTGANGWFVKTLGANEGAEGDSEPTPAFIPIAYPDAAATLPFGINNSRAVVGAYIDSSNGMHGFLAKADF